VSAQLLTDLCRLREPEALPAWLIQVTWRRCNQLRKERLRDDQLVDGRLVMAATQPPGESVESLIHAARLEQILRDVLGQSAPRCRRLIEMLFFENPARPYPEVAASLGIATGSVGFIRRRCLDRLKASLEAAGFP
jgi:DNA-directed RNA polymerase specialized sigma24 family protein